MSLAQLPLPSILRRINTQKADERVGVAIDIVSDIPVIHPLPTPPRLAAEHDRLRFRRTRGPVILVPHRQIDFDSRPRPCRLPAEIIPEVIGIRPNVRVNINDACFAHDSLTDLSASFIASSVTSMSPSECAKLMLTCLAATGK